MTEQVKAESPGMTAEMIAQLYPTIAEGFHAEGASQERERIKVVEEQLIPGHEAPIEKLKFDGKTVPAFVWPR